MTEIPDAAVEAADNLAVEVFLQCWTGKEDWRHGMIPQAAWQLQCRVTWGMSAALPHLLTERDSHIEAVASQLDYSRQIVRQRNAEIARLRNALASILYNDNKRCVEDIARAAPESDSREVE